MAPIYDLKSNAWKLTSSGGMFGITIFIEKVS